jgi:hypothetical protein
MKRVRWGAYVGSHLPVLLKLLPMTSGPILEMGSGFNSTPVFHWTCFPTKRRVVTYENNPQFFQFATGYQSDFHEIKCVENFTDIDISGPWSIAFLDSDPHDTRVVAIQRLLHTEYLVVHDTQLHRRCRETIFDGVFQQFKYQYKYQEAWPGTSVLSNVHDLSGFSVART